MTVLARLFTEHPEDVGETYFEHFGAALRYAGLLTFAGFAAFIHALVPGLCKTTASRIIAQISSEISARSKA